MQVVRELKPKNKKKIKNRISAQQQLFSFIVREKHLPPSAEIDGEFATAAAAADAKSSIDLINITSTWPSASNKNLIESCFLTLISV